MPYLSKITLNPLRRGAQQLLANPQALHAAVLGGVAQQPVTERVLWREERSPHQIALLVSTATQPSWEHLVEQAGWSSPDGAPVVRDLSPLLDRLAAGDQYGFKLRANPVQRKAHLDGQPHREPGTARTRGVRVAHRTLEQQLRWFVERAGGSRQAWGFTVVDDDRVSVRLTARETATFRKGSAGERVTLSRATFQGRLRVTDPDLLRRALLGGVGSGKAYGCGLLTLAAAVPHVVAG